MEIQVYQSDETGRYYIKVGDWHGGVLLRPLLDGTSRPFAVDREELEQRYEKVASHDFSS